MFCTIIRPQDWVPGFFEKPLISWLAGATVVVILFERMALKTTFLMKVPQNWFMVGMMFCVVMSHVMHTYFWGMQNAFNKFLIPFLLFFIMMNALNRPWKMRGMIWFIIGMVSVLVLQGMHQLQNGAGWAGQLPIIDLERQEIRINWIGIFYDPNDLALLFVMAVGFLLPIVFRKHNFIMKIAAAGLIGWLGYGVLLTNSRGGFLALLGTVFFFFVRLTNKMFLGSLIGGLAAAAMLVIGPSRMGLMSASDSSSYGRLELWYWGLQKMIHNPLFGVGYDMFMDDMPLTAHNSYILAASELGFIGLFMWMSLIYVSFSGLSKVYVKVDSLKNMALGIQSSLMGFCVAAFFLSRTYIVLPYMLFALAGAVMIFAKEIDESIDLNPTNKDYRNIILLCVGILVFVYVLYKVGL